MRLLEKTFCSYFETCRYQAPFRSDCIKAGGGRGFCERRAELLELKLRATLAQLVERLIRNQQVAGSTPAGGSSLKSIFPFILSPAFAWTSVFVSRKSRTKPADFTS